MGRATSGVLGMRFNGGDELLSLDVVREGMFVLVATDGGYAKRTPIEDYPVQGRGGKGVLTIQYDRRRGTLVGALIVDIDDELYAITSTGGVIRTSAREVRKAGRQTKGVRLMNLGETATLLAVARNAEDDADDDEYAEPVRAAAPRPARPRRPSSRERHDAARRTSRDRPGSPTRPAVRVDTDDAGPGRTPAGSTVRAAGNGAGRSVAADGAGHAADPAAGTARGRRRGRPGGEPAIGAGAAGPAPAPAARRAAPAPGQRSAAGSRRRGDAVDGAATARRPRLPRRPAAPRPRPRRERAAEPRRTPAGAAELPPGGPGRRQRRARQPAAGDRLAAPAARRREPIGTARRPADRRDRPARRPAADADAGPGRRRPAAVEPRARPAAVAGAGRAPASRRPARGSSTGPTAFLTAATPPPDVRTPGRPRARCRRRAAGRTRPPRQARAAAQAARPVVGAEAGASCWPWCCSSSGWSRSACSTACSTAWACGTSSTAPTPTWSSGEAPSGSPLISAGRVFGVAAVIGAINSLLFAVAVHGRRVRLQRLRRPGRRHRGHAVRAGLIAGVSGCRRVGDAGVTSTRAAGAHSSVG